MIIFPNGISTNRNAAFDFLRMGGGQIISIIFWLFFYYYFWPTRRGITDIINRQIITFFKLLLLELPPNHWL